MPGWTKRMSVVADATFFKPHASPTYLHPDTAHADDARGTSGWVGSATASRRRTVTARPPGPEAQVQSVARCRVLRVRGRRRTGGDDDLAMSRR